MVNNKVYFESNSMLHNNINESSSKKNLQATWSPSSELEMDP